jgi:hypothetical protein
MLQGLQVDIERMLKTAEALRTFHSDPKQPLSDVESVTMPEVSPEAARVAGLRHLPLQATVEKAPVREAVPVISGASFAKVPAPTVAAPVVGPPGVWSDRLLRLRGEALDLVHGLSPGTSYAQMRNMQQSVQSVEAQDTVAALQQEAPVAAPSNVSSGLAAATSTAAAPNNSRFPGRQPAFCFDALHGT